MSIYVHIWMQQKYLPAIKVINENLFKKNFFLLLFLKPLYLSISWVVQNWYIVFINLYLALRKLLPILIDVREISICTVLSQHKEVSAHFLNLGKINSLPVIVLVYQKLRISQIDSKYNYKRPLIK
jgi:hypothetical protein